MESTFKRVSSLELKNDALFRDITECDGFIKADSILRLIQNMNHQYLCLDGDSLVYQSRTRSKCKSADCRFIIHMYNADDSSVSGTGRPIMLQVQKGECYFTVCCDQQEKQVYVRQNYPVPNVFDDCHHDALFFLKDIMGQCNLKCMESARWPRYYLSVDKDEEMDSAVYPNVVLMYVVNEVNDKTNLVLINPKDL